MTTLRERAKRRLAERKLQLVQLEQIEQEVALCVHQSLGSPDDAAVEVILHAGETDMSLDHFHACVKVNTVTTEIDARYSYVFLPASGISLGQDAREGCAYDEPVQEWRAQGKSEWHADFVDALLDATGWTLEDLT